MSNGFYIFLSVLTLCSTAAMLISAYKVDQERKGGATPPGAHRSRHNSHALPRSILQ